MCIAAVQLAGLCDMAKKQSANFVKLSDKTCTFMNSKVQKTLFYWVTASSSTGANGFGLLLLKINAKINAPTKYATAAIPKPTIA
jgi:hypothetical protein